MAPEGMVHALEQTHSLLAKDGVLIDIHPTHEPPTILITTPEKDIILGFLEETDDFIEYIQADHALAAVLRQGLFVADQTDHFNFRIVVDSVPEMIEHLSEEWADAIIPDHIQNRARTLLGDYSGTAKLVIQESISITRIRLSNNKSARGNV